MADYFVLTLSASGTIPIDWRELEDITGSVDERPNKVLVAVAPSIGVVDVNKNLVASIDEDVNLSAVITEVPGLRMTLNWVPGRIVPLQTKRLQRRLRKVA